MPNDDPQLRASDDDRDRTASLLREHHAAGRLNADEFTERLDATYEAKTLGQLQELLADLPSIDLYHLPEQSMRHSQHAAAAHPPATAEHHGRLSAAWRHHWASWASVSLVLFVIWAIGSLSSGHMNGFWFLWVSGPWGAILLSRWLFGQHPGPGQTAAGGPGPGPGRIHSSPAGHLPSGHPAADQFDERNERMEQAFEERRKGVEDHMQRRRELMQDHVQRQQDRLQRHQERLQRRQDRMRRPGES